MSNIIHKILEKFFGLFEYEGYYSVFKYLAFLCLLLLAPASLHSNREVLLPRLLEISIINIGLYLGSKSIIPEK